jgi:gamma-glutamyltranspeptidase/glutathione hydrolase
MEKRKTALNHGFKNHSNRCSPTSPSLPRLPAKLLIFCFTAFAATTTEAQTNGVAGVGAANPMAVEAGLEILRAGGTAVDAAVAVQTMLGLVEPQSSGLGGGGFLMYYHAATGKLTMLDGRETAPRAAQPDMFVGADGTALPFSEAVISGRASGVPGVMAMLGVAHSRFGKLPWRRLFRPATAAADSGFVVPRRLGRFANGSSTQARQPDVRAMFSLPNGKIAKMGDTLRNRAYAATLRQLASRGPRALNEGPIARAIVARTRKDPLPGAMTLRDLNRYQPIERTPICRPYREFKVCVPPPPSSGVSVLQLLAMLEHTDIAQRGPDDPQSWFLFAEASRVMYADRDQYVADPAFVPVPVEGMLDSAYVARRAKLIGDKAGPAPAPGNPALLDLGRDATAEAMGTSHFVIVDKWGNVVSMTATVESVFGSGRSVGGFLLNNEMTDFSFVPSVDGKPVANAVAGGKRPRSSMLPVLIFDRDGKLFGAIGSPGGSAILAYNAKLLVGLLAWKLPVQRAIDLPNIYARGNNIAGEASKLSPSVASYLTAKGLEVRPGEGEDSGLHGFVVSGPGKLDGGADPRRDGVWRTLNPVR